VKAALPKGEDTLKNAVRQNVNDIPFSDMPRRDLALHDHKMTLPVPAFEKYCPWVSKIA
jgi:hypothetical protein